MDSAQDTEVTTLLLNSYQKALGHELPNLLVAGQGLARLLLLEVTDPEQRSILERLAQSMQRSDLLVRRLAALGRILREPPRLEPCSLGELIDEVSAELRATRGLTPVRPVHRDLPTLRTDQDRLRQVLLVVLRNAAQAARSEEPLCVECTWTALDGCLDVADNGRGLPDRPVETWLQPFPPGATGQGLGLYSAHLLLRSLGGNLTLVRRSVGTQVRLFLSNGDRLS